MTKDKKILLIILLFSLAISLAYSFYFRVEPIVDAKAYDGIGWHLAQTGNYDSSQYALSRPGPGYEYFLGIIYAIFGHSYPAVWVFQSLLHVLTALLVFLTAQLIFKNSWRPVMGLAAAALIGFSPDLITGASMLMTETLSLFLIAATAYLFFKYTEENKMFFLGSTAFFLALAALTRSNLVLLAGPILLYIFFKKDWRASAVFLAIFLLCLTPWTVRNYQLYGIIKPFNAGTGALLASGNHLGATGEQVTDFKWPAGYDELPQLEFDKLAKRDAVEFIKNNPLEFLKLTFYRFSIYFSFARPTGFWFHLHGFSKAATLLTSALYSVLLFIAGFIGAALALRRPWGELKSSKPFYMALMTIMMPLAIIFIVVETRYRYPIYPVLAIFAGYGISEIISNFKANLKVFAIVSGVLITNTLFDVLRNISRIAERITNL